MKGLTMETTENAQNKAKGNEKKWTDIIKTERLEMFLAIRGNVCHVQQSACLLHLAHCAVLAFYDLQ